MSYKTQEINVPMIGDTLTSEGREKPLYQKLKVSPGGKLLRADQDASSSGLMVGERFFDSGMGRWGTCVGFRPPEKALGAPIEVYYDGDSEAGIEPWIGYAMWIHVDQRQTL